MSLIKSISGIRGTIGGRVGENLTPFDVVKFTAAYAKWVKDSSDLKNPKVVVGRDARISGAILNDLVCSTLRFMGVNVIDVGLSTTPTVEVMVTQLQANGGIILTASHNPKQWNALKLLNSSGEFINAKIGELILETAERMDIDFASIEELGSYSFYDGAIEHHIQSILDLPTVDVDAIRSKKFKVAVDAVNSTGGLAVPKLLEVLGCEVIPLYCEPNGQFPHNPEPLPEHLSDIVKVVLDQNADLGVVVDPDVDRLSLICEDGSFFGEEYTLVAVADYILRTTGVGNTVSNLSSSRALKDITEDMGGNYYAAAVGELNVVEKMKEVNAVIGGEGNGGVIYPELHYGRDALVGIALFLSHLARFGGLVSELRKKYPSYFMSKNKLELTLNSDIDAIFHYLKEKYSGEKITTIDGLKIDFKDAWVHFRKSNTEPIVRIYTEAKSQEQANELAESFVKEIQHLMGV